MSPLFFAVAASMMVHSPDLLLSKNAAAYSRLAQVTDSRTEKIPPTKVQTGLSRRSKWAIASGVQLLLAGGVMSASYFGRNHAISRDFATFGGVLGGSVLGGALAGGLGYAATRGGGNQGPSGIGILMAPVGMIAGSIIGGVISHAQAEEPGNRRPVVTAISLAPLVMFAGLCTLIGWDA